MNEEYKTKLPGEPIPIALSFGDDGRVTSITTPSVGSKVVDFQEGCVLGMWVEINRYESLVEQSRNYLLDHSDEVD